MTTKITKYMRDLAPVCVWDPDEEGLEPHVDMNPTKIAHIAKNLLIDAGKQEEMEKEFKDTLYKICSKHMTANNVMLIMGRMSIEEYIEITRKGPQAKDMYAPFNDDPETFISQVRDVQRAVMSIAGTVQEVSVGKLGTLSVPESEAAITAINSVLQDNKLPSIEDLFIGVDELNNIISDQSVTIKQKERELKEKATNIERLQGEVSNLHAKALATPANVEYNVDDVELPNGKVVTKKASEVFKGIKLDKDLEVPVWEWDGPHPDVPAIDPNYIFRPKQLMRVLYAIVTNQRLYAQGHTGSGKTTLIEQVAAHLNWPFIRINFDSEITRMDLIGRDTLVADEDGKVTSQFEDGMLPTAMSGPYICCFDELDFVRPDVAYVMQAALEGNGLRITEDGDRLVTPHPMFRMFGTGNTVGQGDEDGMYQGARPQSMAFLDRFTIWMKVDYLTDKERDTLLSRYYPSVVENDKKMILQYVTEHLEAFTTGKVIQPISPRGMLAICQATLILGSVKEALEMTVIDRCNREDRATLRGIVDRVAR